MSDWTTQRLDSLPVNTLVTDGHDDMRVIRRGTFRDDSGVWWKSAELVGSDIRVVSVPIAALLNRFALEAATDAFVMETDLAGMLGTEAEAAIRAAVGYVTGDPV